MSDFAGIVSVSGRPIEPDWIAALHRPFRASRWSEYEGDGIRLIQAERSPVHAGQGHSSTMVRRGNRVLAGDLRIDNTHEVRRRLHAPRGLFGPALALAAFESDPSVFPEGILGAFSVAVWDASERSLVCARDHFGVRPLYYAHVDGLFSFSTDIRSLTALGDPYRKLDRLRIAEYLEGVATDEERTFYTAIKRLPTASRLTLTDGLVRVERYWSAGEIPQLPDGLSDGDLVGQFKDIFREAVKCRVESTTARIGCLLSGGLDSSSVTCTARALLEASRPLTAFSAVFPSIEEPHLSMIDERRYIDTVCELDGIVSVRLEGDRLTPLSGLEELLDIHGQPFDPPNAYLDFAVCRLASQHGTDILLDGLEGDITISHGVHYLDELAAQNDWSGFLREAKALDERLGRRPGTVFRQYGMEHLVEAGLVRLAAGLLQLTFSGVPWLAARVLKSRLRKRSANLIGGSAEARIISEALAEAVDWSSRGVEPNRPRYPSEREAHIDFLRKAYIPSLMEFTHTNTRHFGMEIRHPMFDRRLVDFAVGLPPRLKLRQGWTRYILREAMGGVVPDTVRWRPGKATLAPNFDLRMAREARHDVESVLDDAGGELRDYVKYDVLTEDFGHDRFRDLWPPVVLAMFLKKRSENPQIAPIES